MAKYAETPRSSPHSLYLDDNRPPALPPAALAPAVSKSQGIAWAARHTRLPWLRVSLRSRPLHTADHRPFITIPDPFRDRFRVNPANSQTVPSWDAEA